MFRKNWNSESCNSEENRSSKGKRFNAEENKYKDICGTNNFEILNGRFWSDTRGELTFINIWDVGWWSTHCWRIYQ
jgi:hypothetical protein